MLERHFPSYAMPKSHDLRHGVKKQRRRQKLDRDEVHGPFSSTRISLIPYSFLSVAPVFAGTPAGTRPTGRAAGSDGPAPEPRARVRAVTARERGGPAWSGRRLGVRDADAPHVISVTRRYAVGRRGALSRESRPHTSHWGPYRCPRTMFISRAAEPQRIRRRRSSILLAISSTCFAVRRLESFRVIMR